MSNTDATAESLPTPVPSPPVTVGAEPESVRDEEAFLDAIVSHSDADPAELGLLRDKVVSHYDALDGVKTTPAPKA
ncbi:MAG: hypothetical protein LBI33_04110 [Propionibacteriaceae bacterium]|jgi:hypothetical protein|nr:hypothetical protein [Propionibacteriaceae bacterium]